MGDYHVHLHPHGERGPDDPAPGAFPQDHIERCVEQAMGRGLAEVAFTEHLYRLTEAGPVLGEFWSSEPEHVAAPTRRMVAEERNLSLDAYVTAVEAAKDGGLPVLLGLEVDFFPDTIDAVLELLEPYPWDVLLGSVHWIAGFAVDDEALIDEFTRRGTTRVYEEYFALETQLAASGAVDVLAHADVVKNHGHRTDRERIDLYDEVARAAAGSGTAVEVSSAGLTEPCAELYPSALFLESFQRHGVGITLASDAHRPAGVGWGLDVAIAAAQRAGYTHRTAFNRRNPSEISLRGHGKKT